MEEEVVYSLLSLLTKTTPITRIRPHLIRLSVVSILPKAAIHVKKAIRGGAFTFQRLF
jgi:hypothetical protein